MRNLIFIMLLSAAVTVHGKTGTNDNEYKSYVEFPIATLGLTKMEISQGTEDALKHYGWSAVGKTDTSIKANFRGRSPLMVDFSDDLKVTIRYKKKKKTDYKHHARLRKLEKLSLINITDCNSKSATELDAETKTRRNVVYALTKSGWKVKKLTPDKLTATSPGNGRVEVTVSSDGSFKMERWDELESEYTNPARDRYLRKIQRVYDRQVVRCYR